jgi:uncharacterized membrane protein
MTAELVEAYTLFVVFQASVAETSLMLKADIYLIIALCLAAVDIVLIVASQDLFPPRWS